MLVERKHTFCPLSIFLEFLQNCGRSGIAMPVTLEAHHAASDCCHYFNIQDRCLKASEQRHFRPLILAFPLLSLVAAGDKDDLWESCSQRVASIFMSNGGDSEKVLVRVCASKPAHVGPCRYNRNFIRWWHPGDQDKKEKVTGTLSLSGPANGVFPRPSAWGSNRTTGWRVSGGFAK